MRLQPRRPPWSRHHRRARRARRPLLEHSSPLPLSFSLDPFSTQSTFSLGSFDDTKLIPFLSASCQDLPNLRSGLVGLAFRLRNPDGHAPPARRADCLPNRSAIGSISGFEEDRSTASTERTPRRLTIQSVRPTYASGATRSVRRRAFLMPACARRFFFGRSAADRAEIAHLHERRVRRTKPPLSDAEDASANGQR